MSQSLENLAVNVKALREKRKLTQQQLCDKSKISYNTLCSIERGHGSPRWDTIELLAEALNVKAHSLVSSLRAKGETP